MNPHRNQYGDGHWRGTQPPLGADAQRPSTSGSRPSAAPSSQQDQRLRPWHYAPPPPPAPPARPAGLPAGSSFPAFDGRPHQGYQGYGYGYHGGYYGAHHGYAYGRPPQLPPPPPSSSPPSSSSPPPASPYLMGNPRRSEEHDRRGLREVHLPWRQGQTRLSPPPPAVDNNGFHYHHPMPVDRSHGSSQVLSTTGGHGAGRDPGWVGGSGRGGRDFGGERGGAPAGHGRKRGYEEMAAEPDQPRRRQQQQQYEQQHQPPNQPPRLPPRLPPHQPRRDRNVVVPPFSGVLENRAKFGLAQRRRDMIQPGRILFLKHQSSIHQFTCLIYQMGDNHKPGGFTRHDFDKVNRFFNHPVIVMEGPNRKSLVKVATLTSLGGLTPDQKYAEGNFNAEKHGSHRAELFRSDYIEVHHPGVSDAAPLPGGQRQLHLKNGKKLMERSYVNVDGGKTYMVEGQYLVPYQDFGEKDPDYRLEDESMVYLNEHRAKLESEREERDRTKWPTGKAPNERW